MIQANQKQPIRILGIDPGYGRVGYGVIEKFAGQERHIAHGLIETSAKEAFIVRLQEIHDALKAVIDQYQPHVAAVEQLFFAKNTKTAIDVAQARGVILWTLVEAGLEIKECTPLQVKQALVGYGKADKRQVQQMVQMILQLPKGKMQDDAADALAVAVTVSPQC